MSSPLENIELNSHVFIKFMHLYFVIKYVHIQRCPSPIAHRILSITFHQIYLYLYCFYMSSLHIFVSFTIFCLHCFCITFHIPFPSTYSMQKHPPFINYFSSILNFIYSSRGVHTYTFCMIAQGLIFTYLHNLKPFLHIL